MNERSTAHERFWPLIHPVNVNLALTSSVENFSTDGNLVKAIAQTLMIQAGLDTLSIIAKNKTLSDSHKRQLISLRGYLMTLKRIKDNDKPPQDSLPENYTGPPRSFTEQGRIRALEDLVNIYLIFRPSLESRS